MIAESRRAAGGFGHYRWVTPAGRAVVRSPPASASSEADAPKPVDVDRRIVAETADLDVAMAPARMASQWSTRAPE
jgi:hypothetical protein